MTHMMFKLDEGKPHDYFNLLNRMFRVVGISFREKEPWTYWIYAWIYHLGVTYFFSLEQIMETYWFIDDLDVFSVVFPYVSEAVLGAAKASILLYNRTAIGQIVRRIEKGVYLPQNEEEDTMIKKCIQKTNRLCAVYCVGVYATVFFGVVDAASHRLRSSDYHDWTMPSGIVSIFDLTKSPSFEFACFYQVLSVSLCFTVVIASDIFMAALLAHIAMQFAIFQKRVRVVTDNARKIMLEATGVEESDPSKIPWVYLQKALKEAIINHMQVIDLAESYENLFRYLLLVQFVTSSCTMCFTLYYMTLFDFTDYKFIQYGFACGDIAFQVFIYCYFGNEVTIQSVALSTAIHEVDFVGTDRRFQKGLKLMVLRSQKPFMLTAGKFTTLSLATFVWIMRAAYSYYMVLTSTD